MHEVINVFDGGAAEYLPVPTNNKVTIVTKLAEVVSADLAMVAAPEWEGSFAELMEKLDEVKTQLQKARRIVMVYADQAKVEAEEEKGRLLDD